MSRVKVTIVTLFAVLALSAVGAASASANWFVGGTELGTGSKVKISTTAKVDTDAVLKFKSGTTNIKVLCKGSILGGVAPEIIGKNEGKATSLVFKECETIEPATGCKLEGQPVNVSTQPIKATVTKGAKAPEDRVTFVPQTKKTFATLPFSEANTCALNESEPVNGAVTVGAPTGQSEEVLQAIEGLGSVENNSLEVAGDKAVIEGGKALLQLESKSKWSFH